jgi:hypothetical protein
VPIPSQKNQIFTVKYLPYNIGEKPAEFQLCVGEYVTVSEIKSKVEEFLINSKFADG